jgi:AcrR family transcriptional regulator
MAARTARSERSREMIVAAAADALVDGDGDFELQEVARRAGVSVGLPYHRFGSKSGLIAAVVDNFYDELDQAIDLSDLPPDDWTVRERERVSRLIDFLYDHPLAAIIISRLARDPGVAAVEGERWRRVIALAARNIAKGQQRGQIPTQYDPDILAAMICGGVRHAAGQALAADPRPAREALTRELWDFILGGLRLPAPA